MKDRLRTYYQKHALQWRFVMVGGFNTLIGIITYPLLYLWLVPMRPHYTLLLVMSQVICISNAYVTNKCWVFQTKYYNFGEYLRFTLFYNLVFVLNLILLPILVHTLQVNPAKIQVIISILVAISSYFWHRYVTFKGV